MGTVDINLIPFLMCVSNRMECSSDVVDQQGRGIRRGLALRGVASQASRLGTDGKRFIFFSWKFSILTSIAFIS